MNKGITKTFNEINCLYISENGEEEITLLCGIFSSCYDIPDELWNEEIMEKIKLYPDFIEIYVNDKKIPFSFDYKMNNEKEIKVKFIFKTLLTNTLYMFAECYYLKSIDLSSFNTSNVTAMNGMFYGCSSLESIVFSSFDTSKVKYMSYMFSECSSLKSLDLSTFNTSNVKDMNNMFCGCSSLISLNLSSFNTSNVTDMNCMFTECSSLKSLDLSSFDVGSVENMELMFDGCKSLELLDISSFIIRNDCNTRNFYDKSIKKDNIRFNEIYKGK